MSGPWFDVLSQAGVRTPLDVAAVRAKLRGFCAIAPLGQRSDNTISADW